MAVVVHFDEDNTDDEGDSRKCLMWGMCRHNPVTRDIVGGGGIPF